jgi:flagellar protein FliS
MVYRKNSYKHTHVTTASPGELIVMLYDGAIRFTSAAESQLRDGDIVKGSASISRAVAIVGYLQSILDERQAPDLVAQLDRLYFRWSHSLTKANIEKDADVIATIREEIVEMREAWSEVNHGVSTQNATGTSNA